jgi:hypothetical protein
MWGKVERRHLASAQEVGDVFHLHKRHGRLLKLDARRHGMVNESVEILSVIQSRCLVT